MSGFPHGFDSFEAKVHALAVPGNIAVTMDRRKSSDSQSIIVPPDMIVWWLLEIIGPPPSLTSLSEL